MRTLSLCLFTLFSAPCFAGGWVKLNDENVVSRARIVLGDIAEIGGLDGERRKKLSRMYVGLAPEIGQAKHMPLSLIERRIVDEFGSGLKVDGPSRVEIRRRATTLRGDWLAQRLRAAVEKRIPYSLDEVAKIVIPRIPDCRVPEGSRVKVSFNDEERFDGHVVVSLAVKDRDKTVVSRRINVKVDRFVSVIGLRADMRRGDVINRQSLVDLRRPASAVPDDAVRRPELLIGAEIRRRVSSGDVLRHSWIKIPPVIKRGDRVRVIAKRGQIQLSTFGQALNDATNAAFVRVRNLSSKKVVTGRASGPGLVMMEF